jgi:hypothetical protein
MQAKSNKTKLKSLDLLGSIRPNWDFSIRYGESKQFFSYARRTRSDMRQRSGLARDHTLTRTVDAGFYAKATVSQFQIFRKQLSKN